MTEQVALLKTNSTQTNMMAKRRRAQPEINKPMKEELRSLVRRKGVQTRVVRGQVGLWDKMDEELAIRTTELTIKTVEWPSTRVRILDTLQSMSSLRKLCDIEEDLNRTLSLTGAPTNE